MKLLPWWWVKVVNGKAIHWVASQDFSFTWGFQWAVEINLECSVQPFSNNSHPSACNVNRFIHLFIKKQETSNVHKQCVVHLWVNQFREVMSIVLDHLRTAIKAQRLVDFVNEIDKVSSNCWPEESLSEIQIGKRQKKNTILKIIWNTLQHSNQTFKQKCPPQMYWAIQLQILSKMKCHMLVQKKSILREQFAQFFEIGLHVMKVEIGLLLQNHPRGCNSNHWYWRQHNF